MAMMENNLRTNPRSAKKRSRLLKATPPAARPPFPAFPPLPAHLFRDDGMSLGFLAAPRASTDPN